MVSGFELSNGLFALLALVPFIILYLIRPKPREMTIPSIMFLFKSPGAKSRSSFLRNFLKDLLFLLQLLILIAIAISAAEPFIDVPKTVTARNIVIVLDISGSMSTGNQFSKAINKAKSEIGARTSIILAENSPIIALDNGGRGDAIRILDSLKPRATSTNLGDAMILGADMIETGKVVVISDFRITEGSDAVVAKSLIESKGLGAQFIDVSEDIDGNFGIIDLRIGKSTSTIYFKNYYPEEKTITVKIGNLAKDLTIGAGSLETLAIETPEGITKIEIANDDPMPIDNIAYISTPEKTKLSTLIITNSDAKFLKSALEASGGASVEIAHPPIVPEPNYDIVVFENFDNAKLLPGTYELVEKQVKNNGKGAIFIARPNMPDNELMPVTIGELRAGANVEVEIENEITNDLELGSVDKHYSATIKPGTVVLAKTDTGSPIIAIKDLGFGKTVYYGIFDADSDFKFSPSYPIFWNNLLNYMVKSQNLADYNYKGGEIISLPTEEEVTTPSGPVITQTLILDERGIYQTGTKKIAVSLLNDKESSVGTAEDTGLSQNIEGLKETTSQKEKQSIVPYILGAVILLLLLEIFYVKFRGDQ